jgi:hypothetical protein
MWPPYSWNVNSYTSSIKKEHAFLAGGIVGGCILGAGLYAAYQAIKYRGMRMVCNNHADVAQDIYSMSTLNNWKLFDVNNNYDPNKLQKLLQYFNQESQWDLIPQTEKIDLIEIYRNMKSNNFTSADARGILHDVSQFHEEIGKQVLRYKSIDRFSYELKKYLQKDLSIQAKIVDIEYNTCGCGFASYIFYHYRPFCIRYKMEDNISLPVPLYAIAYIAINRNRIVLPCLSKKELMGKFDGKAKIKRRKSVTLQAMRELGLNNRNRQEI